MLFYKIKIIKKIRIRLMRIGYKDMHTQSRALITVATVDHVSHKKFQNVWTVVDMTYFAKM